MMKVSMATRSIGSMVVLRENKETPSDREWDDFLGILVKNHQALDTLKILVLTEGGGPNAAQRKRLEVALGGKSVRVAIVTDSPKARFIASAITFLNKEHRGFSTSEIDQAYRHLGMTLDEQRAATQALAELKPLIR